MKLGTLLMQTDGFSSVATVACYSRARELAAAQGQNDKYVQICGGIAASLWAAGHFDEVLGLLGPLAGHHPAGLKPMSRVLLGGADGLSRLSLGALDEARALTDDALRELATMQPEERMDIGGVDPRIVALTQSVSISVNHGMLEHADEGTREALRIADARDHAPSRSWAMSLARWMAFRHGDMAESIRLSQQSLESAERMGFKTRLGSGRILMGRAVVASGRIEEGTRLLQEGFAMWAALGARAGAPNSLRSLPTCWSMPAARTMPRRLCAPVRSSRRSRRSASLPPNWRGCALGCCNRQGIRMQPRQASFRRSRLPKVRAQGCSRCALRLIWRACCRARAGTARLRLGCARLSMRCPKGWTSAMPCGQRPRCRRVGLDSPDRQICDRRGDDVGYLCLVFR